MGRGDGEDLLFRFIQQRGGSIIGRPAGGPHVPQRRGAADGGRLAAFHYSKSLMPS